MPFAQYARPKNATDDQWDELVKLDKKVELAIAEANEIFSAMRDKAIKKTSSKSSVQKDDVCGDCDDDNINDNDKKYAKNPSTNHLPVKKNISKRSKTVQSQVFVRIRPLLEDELKEHAVYLPGLVHETKMHAKTKSEKYEHMQLDDNEKIDVLLKTESKIKMDVTQSTSDHRGTNLRSVSIGGFDGVLGPDLCNQQLYELLIETPKLLHGVVREKNTLNVFCYGHTGTGKTHTVLGYKDEERGLFEHITKGLLDQINSLNEEAIENMEDKLSLQIKVAELYLDNVYDILNHRTECTLREDYSGTLCIRGKADLKKDGKVYVPNQYTKLIKEASDIIDVLKDTKEQRSTGSSSIHDQSSRSHAVIEITIVSPNLLKICEMINEAEAVLHQIGKRKDDLIVELDKELVKLWQDAKTGKYTILPLCDVEMDDDLNFDQDVNVGEQNKNYKMATNEWFELYHRIAKKLLKTIQEFEVATQKLDQYLQSKREILLNKNFPFFNSSVNLIDLAGNDYDHRDISKRSARSNDGSKVSTTAKERKESNHINKDLLALKECISSIANQNQNHRTFNGKMKTKIPPFRNSKLTRILQKALQPKNDMSNTEITTTIMIATISPDSRMKHATTNTLRYAQMLNCDDHGTKKKFDKKHLRTCTSHSKKRVGQKPWHKKH